MGKVYFSTAEESLENDAEVCGALEHEEKID